MIQVPANWTFYIVHSGGVKPGADAIDKEGVIAAPESESAAEVHEAAEEIAKPAAMPGEISQSAKSRRLRRVCSASPGIPEVN